MYIIISVYYRQGATLYIYLNDAWHKLNDKVNWKTDKKQGDLTIVAPGNIFLSSPIEKKVKIHPVNFFYNLN